MAFRFVSVHGTSFNIQEAAAVDYVTRFGWGFVVGGYGHPDAQPWVQVAIPIAGAWQFGAPGPGSELEGPRAGSTEPLTERVRLAEIEIWFDVDSEPALSITHLDVWNGAQQIGSFGPMRERGPRLRRSFPNELLNARHGLNVSLKLDFPFRLDVSENPDSVDIFAGPAYTFNSAAAFFDVESV
jgi:hypothetical protein